MAGNAPVLGAATLPLLTIPSIALFGLMIALFADRTWYWRSARRDGRFSLLFTADCP